VIRAAARLALRRRRRQRGGELVGVGIAGRPTSKEYDDRTTLEITRVCSDGTRNACSMLYGALARAAKALGYECVITYTREDEPGASLRAAGFVRDAVLPARPGVDSTAAAGA
jgi:hypothetical protein